MFIANDRTRTGINRLSFLLSRNAAIVHSQGRKPLVNVQGGERSPSGAPPRSNEKYAMPQSLASLHVHVVFSTKNREPRLAPELRPRLHQFIGGVLKNHDCRLVDAGGTADHLHLLSSLGRTVAIADAVRLVKSNSSGWLHDEFADLRHFHWQTGYGAFSVSQSNVAAVKKYLANQEVHHCKHSFQDEFRKLLRRHEIEWDERYVWD